MELATQIMELSREISRQIALIINRRGLVEYVIVGDDRTISIPKLSTERAGRSRFRGVRLVHTHLYGELLSKEDLNDLALLQLDLIACVGRHPRERTDFIHVAYLLPQRKGGKAWDFIGPQAFTELNINAAEFVAELEGEFTRERGRFYDVDEKKDRCVLVCVVLPGRRPQKEISRKMQEMKDLCYSAGISVADTVVQRPKELHPKYLIGKGKMEEVIIRSRQLGSDLIIFDEELTPGQIMNIAELTELKVIDRNQLILDIFSRRAKTKEAMIQVEVAQLRYILPRLTGGNTALSRLMGGIGGRGPGETKLEMDRRRIRDKIAALEKKLIDVRKVREKKRDRRNRSNIPVVSIVGYTNSGKSTLLNLLTKSEVDVEDKPFSTLNPTTRIIKYPERKNIIVTDTVGFIDDLPQVLLKAFAATLEELQDASLLLHLVDISANDFEEQVTSVENILKSINLHEKRRIIVFNKIDRVEQSIVENVQHRFNAMSISCTKNIGIERLVAYIEQALNENAGLTWTHYKENIANA